MEDKQEESKEPIIRDCLGDEVQIPRIDDDFERSEDEEETFEEYLRGVVSFEEIDLTFLCSKSKDSISSTGGTKTELPKRIPFPDGFETDKNSLLDALKENPEIKDPCRIYSSCLENVKFIKEQGILDRYVFSEEEAAVLFAIPRLMEIGFDFNAMFLSCKRKTFSMLVVLLLRSLRKLPCYRGTLYFGVGSDEPVKERAKNEIFSCNFCVASNSVASVKEGPGKNKFKEIFRVDNCWGYDISDFFLAKDDKIYNSCKT